MPWLTPSRAGNHEITARRSSVPGVWAAPQVRPVEPTAGRADPPLPPTQTNLHNVVALPPGSSAMSLAINPGAQSGCSDLLNSAGDLDLPRPTTSTMNRNTTISEALKARHPVLPRRRIHRPSHVPSIDEMHGPHRGGGRPVAGRGSRRHRAWPGGR